MSLATLASVLVACGRIDFALLARISDAATDSGGDSSSIDPSLVLHFTFDGANLTIDDGPGHHDATCSSCPTATAGRIGSGAANFTGNECLAIADAPAELVEVVAMLGKLTARTAAKKRADGMPPWPARVLRWRGLSSWTRKS